MLKTKKDGKIVGAVWTRVMKDYGHVDDDTPSLKNLYKAIPEMAQRFVIFRHVCIDDLGINQGMILENMVAQMLRANGHELYFHEFDYCPEENKVSKQSLFLWRICPVPLRTQNRNYIKNGRGGNEKMLVISFSQGCFLDI